MSTWEADRYRRKNQIAQQELSDAIMIIQETVARGLNQSKGPLKAFHGPINHFEF